MGVYAMAKYVTYLGLSFYSEGATPKDVDDKLKSIGWYPVYGPYDYAYQWDEHWDAKAKDVSNWIEEYTKVRDTLQGMNVYYNFRTYKEGSEDWKNTIY